jgi:hypothetical protein
MSGFRSPWLDETSETMENRTDETDKSPSVSSVSAKSPRSGEPMTAAASCSRGARPIALPESQALGRCIRCQSDEEFMDTLARLAIRRTRTRKAVEARIARSQMEAEA